MRRLPLHLLEEILFKLDPKSLVKMPCTNKSINSHVLEDPNFKRKYYSRIGSSLLHVSKYASNLLCFHPFGNSRSFNNTERLEILFNILASCSGLLLLSIGGRLCVANPLTNKFRFMDYPNSGKTTCIGFAVDHIDLTTQKFKIVCIIEVLKPPNPDEKMYQFDINTGESWSLSKTTFTCHPSNLKKGKNSKPVYFNGDLHWLRKDGSIVAFNPKTEEARLIPIKFYLKPRKVLLCAGDNRLTLISATEEVVSVVAVENDGKCILVRRIKNEPVHLNTPLSYWNVQAYDGKCLVMRTMKNHPVERVVHSYNLRANKWEVVGTIPWWCDSNRNFFLFKPSLSSSVIGLLDQEEERNLLKLKATSSRTYRQPDIESERRISSVMAIMGLVSRNLCFL
ncbi:PREDICTED: putative F-box/kelch-repeat protein At1g20790 [Camelina sativa]|uniref:F-box/kelch-repeat protein At1g20790 n=1 Tax=Camelina sativa TaxID=90675 RepID=A0ABM0YIS1_CAMSA|nr:PREDICTED: putative F-box/kelch-repeat protein At1g20790 [Camelina sativa]